MLLPAAAAAAYIRHAGEYSPAYAERHSLRFRFFAADATLPPRFFCRHYFCFTPIFTLFRRRFAAAPMLAAYA